jgi:hypothetical protein
MSKVEVHPELRRGRPVYATCHECHRSYRPHNEDQACLDLCDECFEAARYPREQVISIHVKPRPYKPSDDSHL